MALGGPDAQCLEHALTMTERERDEAQSKLDTQEEELRLLREMADLLSATPGWVCAGLGTALAIYRAWKEGR
jgi:hypothetical protein